MASANTIVWANACVEANAMMVSALVEGRDPYPNAIESANITCVGILAHESAMKGGAIMKLPAWTFRGAAKGAPAKRRILTLKR